MTIDEAKERVLKAAKDWADGSETPRSIREHQAYAAELVEAVFKLQKLEHYVQAAGDPQPSTVAPMWPEIPKYLGNPIVFRDANLGIAMVADYQGKQWVFKITGDDKWMTVRPVSVDDPMFILEPLNKVPG